MSVKLQHTEPQFIDPKIVRLFLTIFPKGPCYPQHYKAFNSELGTLFEKHLLVKSKESVPVFILGKIRPGGRRCNEDVESLDAAVLDYDKLSDDQLTNLTLNLKNISHIIYTTHRHKEIPEVARVRVILILSRPVTKVEYKIVHKAISDEIKKKLLINVDQSSNTPSQAYYLPSCPAERAIHKFITFNTGIALDVNQALKNASLSRSKVKANYTAINWNDDNLKIVLSKCSALNELYQRAVAGIHLVHIERRTLGQLFIGIKLPIDAALSVFSNQQKFDPYLSKKYLLSIKAPPACQSVAANHTLCNGRCENIKQICGGSPVAFIKATTKKGEA